MSDCETCSCYDTCNATNTINRLESKLKAVTEEKDKLGEMGAATQDALRRVMSERDALRLRVEKLEEALNQILNATDDSCEDDCAVEMQVIATETLEGK